MEIDLAVFDFLHREIANPFFDAVLPVYREKTTWIPLYLMMVFLLVRGYGWRRTGWLLLCIAVTLAIADQLAASVIKPWVGRLRPCASGEVVRELVSCGGKYSFPSNHATNHFALATILSLTWLQDRARGWRILLYAWAATIALAQVYVGKHWPGDIVAGALLGAFLAYAGVLAYRRLTGKEQIGGGAAGAKG